MRKKNNSGLTLIELSIVIVIVGLLITGIIVGRSLVSGGKTRVVISELQHYNSLAFQFNEAFGDIPGDYRNGSDFGAGALDGNGDGIIYNNIIAYNGEAAQFWYHLKKWGELKDCTCTGGGWSGFAGGGYKNTTTPLSKYNDKSRWVVGSLSTTTYNPGSSMGKTYFNLRGNIESWDFQLGYRSLFHGVSYPDGDMILDAIVNPNDARAIDAKIDDGMPGSGKVLSTNNGSGHDVSPYEPQYRHCIGAGSTYYTGYDQEEFGCFMLFEADTFQ